LGAPNFSASLEREKKICAFLDKCKADADTIFLVGDLFDFWYEYKRVVPKSYVRLLGKLSELSDAGVRLIFFVGNHDMWVKDYFKHEMNMEIEFEPKQYIINGKKFLIGHGDGLGPGDYGYKRLKKVFRNPISQFLFGLFPPALGIGLADYFSKKSRAQTGTTEEKFLGEEKEWLMIYCKEKLSNEPIDYFVFGHRHLPIDYKIAVAGNQSRYINLGDWIRYFTYASFDGQQVELHAYDATTISSIVRG
jgi:UDP-2,3-diacylglucosamine hydrolase